MRCIDRVHLRGSGFEGVNREPARIAKRIQHALTVGVAGQQLAVVALIEEKTRFLARHPINPESVSIFVNFIGRFSCAEQVAVGNGLAVGFRDSFVAFIVNSYQFIAIHIFQSFRNQVSLAVHSDGVSLQYGHAVVKINNKARTAIALAVYKPVTIGLHTGRRFAGRIHAGRIHAVRRFARSVSNDGLPKLPDAGQFFGPVVNVGNDALERENAHRNTAIVVMAGGKVAAFFIEHLHHIAIGKIAFITADGPRKDPGVEPADGLVATSLKK